MWIIFEINFLRHLASAMLSTVLALYFRQFVDSDAAVGAIFFAGYTAALLSNFYSARLIKHLHRRKTLLLALMGLSAAFALFAVIRHTALVFLMFAVYQFMLALFVMDVGLYIKHFSNYRQLAGNTGKLGSIGNLGFLVGPLLGGLLADKFGFEGGSLSSFLNTISFS